jgi:hypothetical protein
VSSWGTPTARGDLTNAYGVCIRETIEGRAVSAGAIHTALGRLEHRGMVASRTESPQGRCTPNG